MPTAAAGVLRTGIRPTIRFRAPRGLIGTDALELYGGAGGMVRKGAKVHLGQSGPGEVQ